VNKAPWRSAVHHRGLYTFDWCDVETCDDPTHFVEAETPAYYVAVEESRLRAEQRVRAKG
jgi:hypothetical protein